MLEAAQSAVLPENSSLNKIFNTLATGELPKFEAFFRRMRSAHPDDIARACLRYLATQGLDEAGRRMAYWLSTRPDYGALLLEPSLLTVPEAQQAAKIMRVSDGRFSVKMTEAFQTELAVDALIRALVVVEAAGDKAPFIPRLLVLTNHADERIRSKAVKTLCELRPNFGLVKRQLQSEDARVRANAVEALWHLPGEEAGHLFSLAANDPHHRVVVNALLGLYYQKDSSALPRIHKLASHNSVYFRAAAMWALGHLRDKSSLPVLEQLSESSADEAIRKRAAEILAEMVIRSASEPQEVVTPEEETLLVLPEETERAGTPAAKPEEERLPATKKEEVHIPLFRTF